MNPWRCIIIVYHPQVFGIDAKQVIFVHIFLLFLINKARKCVHLIKPFSYFYCLIPNQFRIIDARTIALNDKQKNKSTLLIKDADSAINGKATYARICIQKI